MHEESGGLPTRILFDTCFQNANGIKVGHHVEQDEHEDDANCSRKSVDCDNASAQRLTSCAVIRRTQSSFSSYPNLTTVSCTFRVFVCN